MKEKKATWPGTNVSASKGDSRIRLQEEENYTCISKDNVAGCQEALDKIGLHDHVYLAITRSLNAYTNHGYQDCRDYRDKARDGHIAHIEQSTRECANQ